MPYRADGQDLRHARQFRRCRQGGAGACDKCHEPGTGAKYVPYWQKRIKTLYEQVQGRIKALEELAGAQGDGARARELRRRAEEARSILDSVSYDGSWGVHNFKYTEALLLEAEKIASQGD